MSTNEPRRVDPLELPGTLPAEAFAIDGEEFADAFDGPAFPREEEPEGEEQQQEEERR